MGVTNHLLTRVILQVGAHLVLNPSCVCRYKDKSSIHYRQHATSRHLALQSRIQPLLLKRLGLSKYQVAKWHSKVSETFQADDFHIPTCILQCAEIIAAIWIDSSSVEKHKAFCMTRSSISQRKHWTKGTTSSRNRHIRPLIWLRHHW